MDAVIEGVWTGRGYTDKKVGELDSTLVCETRDRNPSQATAFSSLGRTELSPFLSDKIDRQSIVPSFQLMQPKCKIKVGKVSSFTSLPHNRINEKYFSLCLSHGLANTLEERR